MKKHALLFIAGCTAILSACSKNDPVQENPPGTNPPVVNPPVTNPPIETGPPVETSPANSTYTPAFTGQTRIGSVKTTTAVKATVVTSSLSSPWGVAVLPDGRLLVTEKGGNMRIVTATGTVGSPISGVPAVNSGGQGGLLGVCLSPSFATDRMVYWAFSENGTGGTTTSIAKGKLSANDAALENVTVIYRATPNYNGTLHYGGRLVFDRTGNLIISTGERSDMATRPQAQSVLSALGKVIRINTNGQAAPGNPSFSGTGARAELYSIGHRNVQGLAIHPTTGDLWEGEHGPRGGDEINLIKAGANYGWPTIGYGMEYNGQKVGEGKTQQAGMEQPAYYWDPIIAPSGMSFYKGNRVPEWENNLFVCALAGQHVARLVIQNNKVVGEERLFRSENQRFRDITQAPNNVLYAVTDGGRLYRIDKE
ncbi:PQQ-dependent sugar dehydrogenase [Mucilaginibacter myungsuensis]|uniref:PQQ-dependent sugar dehydrogenase n=1 Tax=Mucilaginibacter myungsuensis TaxID=649104 RepID=A0A929PXU2_9SPHI|nr:PQQ-dependent sugar dehydrogenase [Mucilaginibacter myungsuensis]MBE9664218.1 PQQ-dependent sugar dehydrogenase [Mucilaginibacter myungsuensis]MDN3599920.1 PQQ-dependent sugar dehydrogenase [Mucilaginibacter myungsuensis]